MGTEQLLDMARRVTMHDADGELKAKLDTLEGYIDDESPPAKQRRNNVRDHIFYLLWRSNTETFQTIEKLPDKVLLHMFSYLPPQQVVPRNFSTDNFVDTSNGNSL